MKTKVEVESLVINPMYGFDFKDISKKLTDIDNHDDIIDWNVEYITNHGGGITEVVIMSKYCVD